MLMKQILLFILCLWILPNGECKSGNEFKQKHHLYTAKGKASYYANKFNGRCTTSGERFCNDSLTAAHKTLPFGTIVKVTNLQNDSVVIVRITDRLPKKSTRIIDLSRAAAIQLDFIKRGLTQVYIEQINRE